MTPRDRRLAQLAEKWAGSLTVARGRAFAPAEAWRCDLEVVRTAVMQAYDMGVGEGYAAGLRETPRWLRAGRAFLRGFARGWRAWRRPRSVAWIGSYEVGQVWMGDDRTRRIHVSEE